MNMSFSPSPTGRFLDQLSLEVSSASLVKESDPHGHSRRTQRRKELRENPSLRPLPEFIGVDGEGIAAPGNEQRYVLLGVGDRQVEDPDGLEFGTIMSFLYQDSVRHPQAVYVGFYLGYDFTHWLKGLPHDRARSLFTSEGMESRRRTKSGGNTVPFPVRYAGWEFDLLPGNRRFRLRPVCCGQPWKCGHQGQSWLYICDAGPFFQTSLLNAVDPTKWKDDPIVSTEEYEALVEGKESRGVAVLDASMRRYNALENQVLGRLMERQARGLADMGIRLSKDQWFGPGQVSAAWLGRQGIPKRQTLVRSTDQKRFQELARRAYFGGWFEIFMHGKVAGESHAYDINSAYPFVMASLPCLLHGHYDRGRSKRSMPTGSEIVLLRGTVRGDDVYVGSSMHRSSASRILRPLRSSGYFWRHELEAGMRAGVVTSYTVDEWWSYEPCDSRYGCTPPLAKLADLYQLRASVGKDTSLGKAAKLVYNSAYGKFAQSVGAAPFGNWVYASLTTAGCRCIILDAIATHPHGTTDLEMVATDGVFFRSPHPELPITDALGDWSHTVKTDLVLYKPGFYWDRESKITASFRSRGIRGSDFVGQIPHIERQFSHALWRAVEEHGRPIDLDWPTAYFQSGFAIQSPLLALRQGKWETAGRLLNDRVLEQASDPANKRIPHPFADMQDHWQSPVLRTLPYEDQGASRIYDKHYADEDPWSPEHMEEYGLTPDGTVVMEWNLTTEELRGNA